MIKPKFNIGDKVVIIDDKYNFTHYVDNIHLKKNYNYYYYTLYELETNTKRLYFNEKDLITLEEIRISKIDQIL